MPNQHPSGPKGDRPDFPMRINKYLALNKYSTRRGADDLIRRGQVLINGRVAVLGDKVNTSDKVEVRLKGKKPGPFVYFAYNKPKGVATYYSGSKEGEYPEELGDVFAVGGLDKDSRGLIILTNDGRITERLLSPKYDYEREYVVVTKNPLRSSFKKNMQAGVRIEDGKTKACKVQVINEYMFKVILTEERKHQVRRMCAALFQEVGDLQRVRILNVSLDKLKAGSYRKLEGEELKEFLGNLL